MNVDTPLEEVAIATKKMRESVHAELGRNVIGYQHVAEDLLIGLLAEGHILIEGVPGIAKTTLAKVFSQALHLDFNRIQFTQDLLPSDITGHNFWDQKNQEFKLRTGPVFTNVLLADEINRAPPKTQSALLESMEERQVTIEGETRKLARPFMVIATMNPIDVEGVYGLPEAQMDRFMLRTQMEYLSHGEERDMLLGKLNQRQIIEASTRVDAATIALMHARLLEVQVSDDVLDYLITIVRKTREHPDVTLGVSPRAMEQMLQASRAWALLSGRTFVIPDDVKRIAHGAMDHRIIMNVDAEVEGGNSANVVDDILSEVLVPKGL